MKIEWNGGYEQRFYLTVSNHIPSKDFYNLLQLAGKQSKATTAQYNDTSWAVQPHCPTPHFP